MFLDRKLHNKNNVNAIFLVLKVIIKTPKI